jgi:hypothetical protein
MAGINSRSNEHDESTFENNGTGWHPGLPKAPGELLKVSTLKLTRDEAVYLRDRVLQSHKDSLFALFLVNADNGMETSFLWEHPSVASFPETQQNSVLHARNFSEVMHGAALLYNLMLSEAKENDDGIEKYTEWLDKWALELLVRWAEIDDWCQKREIFWKSPAFVDANISWKTRRFVDSWLTTILENNGPKKVYDNSNARNLISYRELELKKKTRARLHNLDALARWSGASGTARLNYRWGVAKTHLTDIYSGLNGKEGENA